MKKLYDILNTVKPIAFSGLCALLLNDCLPAKKSTPSDYTHQRGIIVKKNGYFPDTTYFKDEHESDECGYRADIKLQVTQTGGHYVMLLDTSTDPWFITNIILPDTSYNRIEESDIYDGPGIPNEKVIREKIVGKREFGKKCSPKNEI